MRTNSTREPKGKKEEKGPGRDPALKRSELTSIIKALMQPTKKREISLQNRTEVEREIRRREFVAAASRLQDDDS